jgi:hypothetical protein
MKKYHYRITPFSGFFIIERRKSFTNKYYEVTTAGRDMLNQTSDEYIKSSKLAVEKLKIIKKVDERILRVK